MTQLSAKNIKQSKRLWDINDLIRRLCNALEIAERAVHLLAPLGYEDPEDSTVGVTAEKVVAETALLLLACRSIAIHNTDVGLRLQRIAAMLIPHARNEQVLIKACLNPGLARDYAFAHICLSRLGFPDRRIDKFLHLCFQTEAARCPERFPHRMLEQEWLKRVWSPIAPDTYDEFGLVALSILGHPLDVFAATRDDIYAFTHAVMYISDLGERKAQLPRQKQTILADADAALACCLDQQDYDLGGEILLAWPYLDAKWSATAAFAFRVLTRVEDVVGFLPAPLTRLDRYHSLSQEEQARYAMATVYHTAYVMGLLCGAALKQDQRPPLVIPRVTLTGSAEALLKVIDRDGYKPHWRDDFAELDAKSQDALVPMLMTIALKRAVTARNLEQVRSLLVYGLEHGCINYPAIRQAADLLRRFAEVIEYAQKVIPIQSTFQSQLSPAAAS